MDQKDRVKERESRRNDRRLRIQERASLGRSGPEIVPPVAPVFDDDGPRTTSELRDDDIAEERRYRDPDEAADAD